MRAWLLALLLPSLAWAHGGLPISQGVMRQGDNMYIPVVFWGVWVGHDNGPWTWICEEVINLDRTRHYALSSDGTTFYTTDTRGLTISNDHGCTWLPATGELAAMRTSEVVTDPADGATAWATTEEVMTSADGGSSADNALFVTHDHGTTFARVPSLAGVGRRFHNVKVAAGGVIYVISAGLSTPFGVSVHFSGDSGANFEARPLNFSTGGVLPYSAEVMAVDPRDPNGVYLRAFVTLPAVDGGDAMPLQILLRSSDGGASVTEVMRMVGEATPSGATRGIDGVAVDGKRGKVYVATAMGLYAGADPGGAATVTVQPTGGLSQAQCVEVHDDAVYVCSSNYSPDFAALARSDDGALTFHQVLSYQATVGPVDCPAGTPVGDQCPFYWNTYAANLGINMGIDGGADAGGGGGGSCDCALGGRAAALPSLLLLVAGLVALARFWIRRLG